MSQVVNNEGIRPGCIYRIALENFVTYKQVVLHPGPSLNMIIGPNGTGKSTFVCAIILGLCGKTSVIGRAKKISEYVRSGCQQATIEIELYQKPGQHNVIITRNFNLNDVSTWSIDNKAAREKQVQDLIAALNIQVDNLCQLLPQDRVQDFSKMDPQQLLRSTLAAVGGSESVQQLEDLIDTRNQQRGLTTKLTNNAQVLAEQTQLNERLKVLIDAMQQRKHIEQQIEMCEKKKLWLEYQELREKVIEYTNDKKQAVKLVSTHQSKIEPLQEMMDKAKSGISRLEQQKLAANREIHTLKDKAKEIINTVRNHEYSLKEIEASFQEKMERHRNREQELVESRVKLDKLRTDKERLCEKVGDDASVKMDLDNVVRSIAKCNAGLDSLKKQKLEIQYDLENNIIPQIRLYQNRIRNLEDVDVKRLEVLRSYSEDCYKAVMWLRENRDMFEHSVHEPMMLEINFTDPKFARYLESTVPARDLVAFTFESSADMNLFLQKVRTEGGLRRVNAICSQGGRFIVQTNNIQQLSYLGFYTYLVDTITAPDAIVRYLCKSYSIHKIPIGNEHTYNNSGRVPANITFFYTENHRFSVRVSAYSGAKSSSTIEIRPARLLANTVDVDQVENFTQQLSNFDKKSQNHKSRIQDLDQKISVFEVSMNELNTKRKNINDGVEKVRTISAQIRLQTQKVQDIENEPSFNVQQERERCKRKQRDCVMKQCELQRQLCDVMKNYQGKQMNGDIWKCVNLTAANSISKLWMCPGCTVSLPRKDNTNTPVKEPEIQVSDESSQEFEECSGQKEVLKELRALRKDMNSFRKEFGCFRDEAKGELRDLRAMYLDCEKKLESVSDRLVENESRLSRLETSSKETSDLKMQIDTLKQELNNKEQVALQNDIELSGVTEHTGENSMHLAGLIMKKIGMSVDERDIVAACRVGPVRVDQSGKQRPRPIVLRLARRVVHEQVLRCARARRSITTGDIELVGTSRPIYINERLTRDNRIIFGRARTLCKQFKWKYAWSRDGRILIREADGKQAFRVRSEGDLESIFKLRHNTNN